MSNRLRPFLGDSALPRHWRTAHSRGQSMVEFALVLPLLMVLLLGVADFGRLFSAGVTIEASARNAAETGAIERLRNKPPNPPVDPALTTYYQALHLLAAKAACSEARLLPNATFDASARTCASMPAIRVCVRDGLDPICGASIAGFDPAPAAECNHLTGAWRSWDNSTGGTDQSHSVEVRICYHFTTLFNLDLNLGINTSIQLGDIWLQKERIFVVDCPPGDVATC